MSSLSDFNPLTQRLFISGAHASATSGIGSHPVWPVPGSHDSFQMLPTVNQPMIYQLVVSDIAPGDYQYKFFSVPNTQTTWQGGEWPGSPNRTISVRHQDTSTMDLWGIPPRIEPQIIINEIMASNGSVLSDEDGDFEDWIELYNPGQIPVNLLGFSLTDHPLQPQKWIFPEIVLYPRQYLLVWASGKDRTEVQSALHTRFSLSSAGEPLLLFDPSGTLMDSMPSVEHRVDISFGRFPNAGHEWKYMSHPTPTNANVLPAYNRLIPPPTVSPQDGYFTDSMMVYMSSDEPGLVIRYTLDGSEPQEHSPQYELPFKLGELTHVPHVISNIPTNQLDVGPPFFEGWQPPLGNVRQIHVIRARTFGTDAPPSPVITATYLPEQGPKRRYTMPIISMATSPQNLFDEDIGTYVWGRHGNYWKDWERPCHFTGFDAEGNLAYSLPAGFQLNGNTTRSRPRKSIRMIFKSAYGPSRLDYPVFGDQKTNAYKRLILRNGGNDWGHALVRDGVAQILASQMKVETQEFKPTILFINGEYWGIHNLRERYSTHYFEEKYGISEHQLTVLENNALYKRGNPSGLSHFQTLMQYIQRHPITTDERLEFVGKYMDLESFIDFLLANIYVKNTDWPGNNQLFWRYITTDQDSPSGVTDGRWRWMLFDLDFGFDLGLNYVPHLSEGVHHNTLKYALSSNGPAWPNPPWSTLFFRQLIAHPSFTHRFINRYCDLLNTVYRPEFVVYTIDSIQNRYAPEIQEHIRRWRMPADSMAWVNEMEGLKRFGRERAATQFDHMKEVFGLGELFTLTLQVNDNRQGWIRLNTIDLVSTTHGIGQKVYPWRGNYWNNVPVTITAKPLPGFVFSHWSGSIASQDTMLTIDVNRPFQLTAHFVPDTAQKEQLLYFWFFGSSIPNDEPIQKLSPTFQVGYADLSFTSCLPGYPFHSSHVLWRKSSMERRNAPTRINYVPKGNKDITYEQAPMRGIQIRQPMRYQQSDNTLILSFSTVGFHRITLRLAAMDEGAAHQLKIDYGNPAIADTFSSIGLPPFFPVTSAYSQVEVPFGSIPMSSNADSFLVRIRFVGNHMTEDKGKRITFNNISVTGSPLPAINDSTDSTLKGKFYLYPNPSDGIFTVRSDRPIQHMTLYDHSGKKVYQTYSFPADGRVDVSFLRSGLYLLKASDIDGHMHSTRFLMQP